MRKAAKAEDAHGADRGLKFQASKYGPSWGWGLHMHKGKLPEDSREESAVAAASGRGAAG